MQSSEQGTDRTLLAPHQCGLKGTQVDSKSGEVLGEGFSDDGWNAC